MLERLSKKVKVTSPSNVSSARYSFLSLSDAEPSLGMPAGNNYILTGNTDGTRVFRQIGNVLIAGEGIAIQSNGLIINTGTTGLGANAQDAIAFKRFDFSANVDQVIFGGKAPSLANANVDLYGQTLELSNLDVVSVYYNGVLLQPNVDYTYSNAAGNSNVVLTLATEEESIVSVVRVTPTTLNLSTLTNATVRAAFTPGVGITIDANGLISANPNVTANVSFIVLASNVIENGNTTSGNVFFTNTRARGAFTSGAGIVLASNGLITANISNLAIQFSGTTSNVPEGANLYFTNTRARSAFTAGSGIDIGIDGTISYQPIGSLYTSNIIENGDTTNGFVYFTNDRVIAALTAGSGITIAANGRISSAGITGSNLFATNVIENGNTTTGNVFFTNNRARSAFTAGQNIFIESNGLITANVTAGALPTLFTPNIVEVGSTTTGNVYFSNTRARRAFTAGPGIQINETTGAISSTAALGLGGLYASNVFEDGDTTTGNVFFTNARVHVAMSNAFVSTGNIREGSNLYFTNTRARSAFTAGQNIVISPNGLIQSAATLSGLPEIFASNVVEDGTTTSGNVFFSNLRARRAFTAGPGISSINTSTGVVTANIFLVNGLTGNIVLTTDSISEAVTNRYFTNTRAIGAFTAGSGITIFANGLITSSSNFSGNTDQITEGVNNLYYTNTRARYALSGNTGILYDSINGIIRANVTSVAGKTGAVTLETSNVTESGNTTVGNVYFSNSRVVAALTAGQNIVIQPNGMIISAASISSFGTIFTSNVVENGNTTVGNVYFSNARTVAALTGGLGINVSPTGTITNTGTFSVNNLTGNILLYTGNVIESGNATTGNVFFSNARARSAFTAGNNIILYSNGLILADLANVGSQSIAANSITSTMLQDNAVITSKIAFGAVTANSLAGDSVTTGKILDLNVTTGKINDFAVTAGKIATGAVSNVKLANIVTADIRETSGNLYFTNTRAVAAIQDTATLLLGNLIPAVSAGRDIGNATHPWRDVYISAASLKLGNITLRESGNALTIIGGTSNVNLGALSTSNVSEGSNLYYTDARVFANVANISTLVRNASLNTSNVVEGSNLYFTTERTYANILNTSIFVRNASLTTANVAEVTNLYYTDARVFANVANISTLLRTASLNTSNVVEGTNLYYTNVRVYNAIAGNLAGYAKTTDLTTANVAEVTNLYYTNARVYANVIGLINAKANTADLSTSNIREGSNLYYTDTRARAAISIANSGGDGNISYNSTTGLLTYIGPGVNNYRAAFSQGTGISIVNGVISATVTSSYGDSNARQAISVTDTGGDGSLSYDSSTGVITYVGPSAANVRAHFSSGTGINYDSATGIISATGISSYGDSNARSALSYTTGSANYNTSTGQITIPGTSDHVTEGSTNLFFTTQRARDSFTAGTGIDITNGVVSTTGGGTGSSTQVGSLGVGTPASGTTGEIRATNNITAYYSDDRLKTKLGNIENALDKVKQLTGFYYEANDLAESLGYTKRREVGLSAQDANKVLPEVVTTAPIDPQYLTIWYEKMIPLLVEAIKELSIQVDEIKRSLNE